MVRQGFLAASAACVLLVALAVAASTPGTVHAQTVRLWATEGYGGTLGTLLELDPATGAILDTVGPIGYTVNGLDWDPTTDTLYASTSVLDPSHVGLISINRTTGAGTPIGASGWGLGFPPITNITVNSAGDMFGWSEAGDNLVSINKATGVATVVGLSGVGTAQNGLSFTPGDVLYMVNFGGTRYEVNTATGLATFDGTFGQTAHHGDFHPITGNYFGLTFDIGSPRNLLECTIAGSSCAVIGPVGDVHTLAFELVDEVVPTPTPIPGVPGAVGGVEVGALVPITALDAENVDAVVAGTRFAMASLDTSTIPYALGLMMLLALGAVAIGAVVVRRQV